jgi:hypothetical protein
MREYCEHDITKGTCIDCYKVLERKLDETVTTLKVFKYEYDKLTSQAVERDRVKIGTRETELEIAVMAMEEKIAELTRQNEMMKELLINLDQWSADKISIVPSMALRQYAKQARQILEALAALEKDGT